ncbi:hypothetical protein Tco_0268445 [Tanacetum coccineum]
MTRLRIAGREDSIIKSTSLNCLSLPSQRSAILRLCVTLSDLRPPCNLDSLKNWNNHFFWIDAFVCLIFVLWYNDVSDKKNLLPSDDVVDLPLLEKLNENRTLIRKYPEDFLSIIGLSHPFIYTDIRPAFIGRDKNDMGLLDFVKSANPFKVVAPSGQTLRLVDHTIMDELKEAAGKRNRKVGFSVVPPPVKKARDGGIVISKPNLTTVGKTLIALRTLGIQSGQHGVGSGSATPPTKEFVSSSVTPTPKHECLGP